jgi:anthranilate/para-aminobenzoate synthase component I
MISITRSPSRRSDAAAEWEETRAKARGPLRAIGGRVAGEEEP